MSFYLCITAGALFMLFGVMDDNKKVSTAHCALVLAIVCLVAAWIYK